MATTNTTTNYELSQYIGSDVTSYLTNYNADMSKIDAQMKRNADSAATANDNASIAVSTATTAASNASTALSTANTASSTATSAQTAAQEAQTAAGAAQTDAATALRASAANSIENLAPAYDATLTYNVGDLVTYVDENNSGKLYKCIVAIGTPEAFNVNKWDDVTTSEIFLHNNPYIVSYSFTSGATMEAILTGLAELIDFSKVMSLINVGKIPIIVFNNGIFNVLNASTTTIYAEQSCSNNSTHWYSNTMRINTTLAMYNSVEISNGTIIQTDELNSTVPNDGSIKLVII